MHDPCLTVSGAGKKEDCMRHITALFVAVLVFMCISNVVAQTTGEEPKITVIFEQTSTTFTSKFDNAEISKRGIAFGGQRFEPSARIVAVRANLPKGVRLQMRSSVAGSMNAVPDNIGPFDGHVSKITADRSNGKLVHFEVASAVRVFKNIEIGGGYLVHGYNHTWDYGKEYGWVTSINTAVKRRYSGLSANIAAEHQFKGVSIRAFGRFMPSLKQRWSYVQRTPEMFTGAQETSSSGFSFGTSGSVLVKKRYLLTAAYEYGRFNTAFGNFWGGGFGGYQVPERLSVHTVTVGAGLRFSLKR